MSPPSHLMLVGFNDHSFKQLESQINSYDLNLKVINQIDGESIDEVKAIMIDFDSQNLDESLNFCRNKLPPVIGLSNKPVKLDNIKILKKPLREEDFRATLDNMGVTQEQEEQIPSEIRAVYSNAESTLHYPIHNCFQDYLIKAWKLHLKVKQPIEMAFLNKPVLIIFDGKVSGSLTNEQLQQLCDLTIQEHSIATFLSSPPHGLKSIEATYFIAKIILWSSRGRLPEGVNSTDIVHLTNPEKTYSLPKMEDSQLIRKLWSMENCSLQKTEQVLNVSQVNLFSYFSVLYAFGLVKIFPPNTPSAKIKKGNRALSQKGWLGTKLFAKKKLIPNSL